MFLGLKDWRGERKEIPEIPGKGKEKALEAESTSDYSKHMPGISGISGKGIRGFGGVIGERGKGNLQSWQIGQKRGYAKPARRA